MIEPGTGVGPEPKWEDDYFCRGARLVAPGRSANMQLYKIDQFWCGPGINDVWDTRADAAAASWRATPCCDNGNFGDDHLCQKQPGDLRAVEQENLPLTNENVKVVRSFWRDAYRYCR